ncbi:MAG: peroxiredoxin [Lentisphaerae bacterium]|nr:peroxiredoxin [Lentisphaerota bacterium]
MNGPRILLPLLICVCGAGALETADYDPGPLKPVDSRLRVAVGDPAPDFALPAISGRRVRLSAFQGRRHVVLSFVPSAFTPVCSAQWPGYHIARPLFEQRDAVVLGLTTDNIPSLYAWVHAMDGLWFNVLSDFWPHGKVADTYGVLRSDGTCERALFVVDKAGIIRYIDVHDINRRPPLDDLIRALDRCQEIEHPAP